MALPGVTHQAQFAIHGLQWIDGSASKRMVGRTSERRLSNNFLTSEF
ncbi:hypothetical protein [Coleofasciculus sp. LEGE 07092]|nr:hypothetical protein [Coleofasciculus sp. LEGE 07092]MBE9125834.1 hypothetical protein [Coleofasciculus sp. LEGE 07081]MBE9149152.1 hypothetical protein [Coleofasciculus sp. LEGE 07092]